jgi:tetratricopeptide (TPR) repeat protein
MKVLRRLFQPEVPGVLSHIFRLLLLAGLLAMLALTAAPRLAQAAACNGLNRTFARLVLGTQSNPENLAAFSQHLQQQASPGDVPACILYQLGLLAIHGQDITTGDPSETASLDQARPFFEKALSTSPAYLAALRTLAPFDTRLASSAIEVYPENPQAWIWAGSIAQAQGRMAEALIAFHRAASLQPSNHLVWESLGGLAEGQGNIPLARQAYQAACDLYPVRNGSCLSAGRLAFNDQDWQTVIYYYPRGFYPESTDGWARLILAGRKLGLAEAADWLEQAQQEYPADYEALIKELELEK